MGPAGCGHHAPAARGPRSHGHLHPGRDTHPGRSASIRPFRHTRTARGSHTPTDGAYPWDVPAKTPTAPTSITARLALPLLSALRAAGHDVGAMLSRLGLDEADLRSLHGRLTLEAFMDLHAACVALTGDASFPLRAAAHLDRDAFPLGFYLMGSQMTLRDGARFIRPYRHVVVDGIEYNLTEEENASRIEFELHGEPLGPPAFAEYLLAIVLALGRILTPEAEPPTEIVFAHRFPRHSERAQELLGAPVRYGAAAVGFVFPKPRIDTKITGADPHLGQLLAQQADVLVSKSSTHQRIRDRVRRFFATRLESGEAVLGEVADALKMSDRTLRRRLASEGTSARDLLDEVRKEQALSLLEEGRRSLDEIAYMLGFSGSNAFRRAFKRWTGTSPTAFVERERHDG